MTVLSTLMKMAFHARLTELRKGKRLTQQALADAAGLNVSQLKRYETGVSQSSDLLVFDKDERGPDDELRLLFEAVTRFDKEAKRVAKALLESLILKQEAKRWTS